MIIFRHKSQSEKFKEFLNEDCIAYTFEETDKGFKFYPEMYHEELVRSHEECARTWVNDEMTRVLDIHKDIDEIAKTFENEVRQADENIAGLLKTIKLAVTFTTPELTMDLIEGSIRQMFNENRDEIDGEERINE